MSSDSIQSEIFGILYPIVLLKMICSSDRQRPAATIALGVLDVEIHQRRMMFRPRRYLVIIMVEADEAGIVDQSAKSSKGLQLCPAIKIGSLTSPT